MGLDIDQQPGYSQQTGYGQQPGYSQQSGYDQQPGYSQQIGYGQQASYPKKFNPSSLHYHPLVYRYRTAWNIGKDNYKCDICGNAFYNRPSYYCESCDFDVCPNCYER